MIIWMFKLWSTFRRAIAGRKYPHQLAWAVAFGLLLGIVPHGNLLALGVLIVVLSLKLNHAMAGLTAIGATFAATIVDPYSHQLGEFVLTHPRVSETAASAWQLPLMPWTDLNNTVVMGSFLIGVVALVPVFVITYPFFRLIAPAADPETSQSEERTAAAEPAKHEIIVVDQGHRQIAKPHRSPASAPASVDSNTNAVPSDGSDAVPSDGSDAVPSDGSEQSGDEKLENTIEDGNDVAVETRIDRDPHEGLSRCEFVARSNGCLRR